jgi:hypothetical protein
MRASSQRGWTQPWGSTVRDGLPGACRGSDFRDGIWYEVQDVAIVDVNPFHVRDRNLLSAAHDLWRPPTFSTSARPTAHARAHGRKRESGRSWDEACPVSTGGGTRRVQSVREEGRGVSSQYGREGGGYPCFLPLAGQRSMILVLPEVAYLVCCATRGLPLHSQDGVCPTRRLRVGVPRVVCRCQRHQVEFRIAICPIVSHQDLRTKCEQRLCRMASGGLHRAPQLGQGRRPSSCSQQSWRRTAFASSQICAMD